MNQIFNYIGYFVSVDELCEKLRDKIKGEKTVSLAKPIRYPHVTMEYRPEYVNRELFGEKIRILVEGYGNDGENEGVKVSLKSENVILQEMIDKIKVPHITISISNEGFAVNTSRIEFHPIEPFEIEGIFGGYVKPEDGQDGEVICF